MNKNFLATASLMGALSVALGAFAAHALQQIVPAASVQVFETGVRYQFYHVFAVLAVAILSEKFPNKWIRWAGDSFITGVILFSGSLYALTLLKLTDVSWSKYVGIVTPFGGLFLIAGWLLLLVGVSRK